MGWGGGCRRGRCSRSGINGALLYCIFTDATGAEYRLDQVGTSALYTSKEGVYLTYDSGGETLYFPDGS